ncbi:MAG: tRNA (adenosine(37)-N6)-threonylcarbamoyltransferase complex transferase subunit TsaD, partial [Terracidiphilus sp.]
MSASSGEHLILGIESSCDETAAAVVADGVKILSNVVASQIDIHRKYGGVVPELASREHLRRIVPVVREAAEQARIKLQDVDAIAVTSGPGLIGALLVGVTYGKVLAQALGKPLIAVNHLEGHVHAVLLEAHAAGRKPELPAVCLIVSGGHTILYDVHSDSSNGARRFSYARIGGTRDDAAGEAYDKVARMLALGYPGGPIIDRLAAVGNPRAIHFPRSRLSPDSLDFSFSGLKTAVLYRVRGYQGRQHDPSTLTDSEIADIAASFQAACVDILVEKIHRAVKSCSAKCVIIGGGVSANSGLRQA